jgi:hypothetical protein
MLTDYQKGSIFGAALLGIAFAFSFAHNQPAENVSQKGPADVASNEQKEESFWQWATRDPVSVFTLALVVVGGAQAALFLWQLTLIRESLVDAEVAAEAATKGAKATMESVNIAKLSMVSGDRAYVYFNGCRWISHRENDTGPVFWRLRPLWINSGNTPTRKLRIYAHYELLDAPLRANYQFIPCEDVCRPAMMSPKGQVESGSRDFYGDDLLAVKEGRKFLYVWGIARYRDVFPDTSQHVTKFCVFATNVSGNPLEPWDEKANPFDISFATFDRHNCADEDCEEGNEATEPARQIWTVG